MKQIFSGKKTRILLLLVLVFSLTLSGCMMSREEREYDKAGKLFAQGDYSAAKSIYYDIRDYEDAYQRYLECRYQIAREYLLNGQYSEARWAFEDLGDYSDSRTQVKACCYEEAKYYFRQQDYDSAIDLFLQAGDYSDSTQQIFACYYAKGEEYARMQWYEDAAEMFVMAKDYSDSEEQAKAWYYIAAENALALRNYGEARRLFFKAEDYLDSALRIQEAFYLEGCSCLTLCKYWEAHSAFVQAGDYEDAAQKAEEANYWKGHTLFLRGDYAGAQEIFNTLGAYPEGEGPHFLTLEEAGSYLEEQASMLNSSFSCYIAQLDYDTYLELYRSVQQYASFQQARVSYRENTQKLTVECNYYPGERIIYAWQTGDDSVLSDTELEAKNKAMKLVKKAKADTQSDWGAELYLFNWICSNVEYESPNMDVPDYEYIRLRQLSCVGGLLDGKANCQGYTDTFYVLATMAGFDVNRFFGTGQGGPHAWNGIMLKEKHYLVDVTFGDAGKVDSKAKNYAYFNCVYDPDTYTIEGGTQCAPELVTGNDLSQSYYKRKKCVFNTITDATNYLAKRCKKNGKGWYYAMVEGKTVSSEDIKSSFLRARKKVGISNGFTYIYTYYSDDTQIGICWK